MPDDTLVLSDEQLRFLQVCYAARVRGTKGAHYSAMVKNKCTLNTETRRPLYKHKLIINSSSQYGFSRWQITFAGVIAMRAAEARKTEGENGD